MGIPASARRRRYGGLNQPRGISRDTGVQLPGHKPLLAHEEDGDESVRTSARETRRDPPLPAISSL
jgi:hypothetical protein